MVRVLVISASLMLGALPFINTGSARYFRGERFFFILLL